MDKLAAVTLGELGTFFGGLAALVFIWRFSAAVIVSEILA